jgi:hypothetical protein
MSKSALPLGGALDVLRMKLAQAPSIRRKQVTCWVVPTVYTWFMANNVAIDGIWVHYENNDYVVSYTGDEIVIHMPALGYEGDCGLLGTMARNNIIEMALNLMFMA